MTTVTPASSGSDRREFINLPYRLHADDPNWVPPLRMDVARSINESKNAFFDHGKIQLYVARDARGEVVGRVAGIINGMHLKKYNDSTGFVGFFECIDDASVAAALLDAATGWLREQGMRAARGPTNPSMNDVCGMLVDGFDRPPAVMMPHNPPHYPRFFEDYGFSRAMTMWAYYVHRKYVSVDKLKRGVDFVYRRNPSLAIREMDMSRFDEEARIILDIYNEAWSRNWGHVPMTDAEFAQLAKEMKQVVDPRVVFIVEDDGHPVAFSISLPNINQALIHIRNGRLLPFGLPKLLARAKLGGISEVRTLLMGSRLKWQGKGLDAILNLATIERGPTYGYEGSEMSWVLDSNPRLINALHNIGGVRDKEYAMYEITF